MTVAVACALAVFLVALYGSWHHETAVALHDMPCADLDGDGEVTTIDEQIIWSYWGQNVPPAPPQANLEPSPPIADNDVDINDVQYLLARIGQFTDCQDTPIVIKAPENQPDLVVDGIEDAQQPFVDCQTPAGVKVTIRNAGTAWAGPSTTHVSSSSGSQSVGTPMLAPGQTVTVFSTVQGIPIGDSYTAVADFTGAVAESDETNNTLVAFLSLGTLPTCTSTPEAPTPTPPPAVGGIAVDGAAKTLPLEEPAASHAIGSTAQ